MAAEGLDAASFVTKMREFATVEKLSGSFAEQIEQALPMALAINTARHFLSAK
jgi:hypothetical protein